MLKRFIKPGVLGWGVLALSLLPGARGEGTLETLVSFNGNNGSAPWGGVVQAPDGNWYGTTSFGGEYGFGTVFKMSPGQPITVLHSFRFDSEGLVPQAGLTFGTDGFLYGTTRDSLGYSGTVFRITTNGLFTLLVRFNGNNGAQPWNGALIQASGGDFYGMTTSGGNTNLYPPGFGTVYKVTPGGSLTTLFAFNNSSGAIPYGGLLEGRDGNFYGMTSTGGRLIGGTVFKLTPQGAHTELASFSYRGTNGLTPFSGLIQGSDGNFYGTTTEGGTSYGNTNSVNYSGFGTIFKMTPGGQLTTLFSFQGTNGAYPYASLAQGPDGHFYGVTLAGGAFTNQLFPNSDGYAGYGTAFRITRDGAFTSLVSFAGTNGAQILGNLTLGKDRKLYGTALKGGAQDHGTVFRLSLPFPPTINCPAPVTVECGSPVEISVSVSGSGENPLAVIWSLNGQTVQTNAIASENPPLLVTLSLPGVPPGTNVLSVSVIDAGTNVVSCSTHILTVDSTPPVMLSPSAQPSVLWPPNHQMQTVNLRAVVTDNCGAAAWKVIAVSSNESDRHGAQHTSPDWQIIDDHTVKLRAERSGPGIRIYTVTLQATDEFGNVSEPQMVTVRVAPNVS